MPLFTIVIRNREGSPIEGEVQAVNVDDAIVVARRMGHDVDEEATRELTRQGLDKSGKTAAVLGVLVSLPAVVFPHFGLAGLILGVLAVEFSRGRRGWTAVTAGLILTGIGMVLRLVVWDGRTISGL
jgi:hypothetical protein